MKEMKLNNETLREFIYSLNEGVKVDIVGIGIFELPLSEEDEECISEEMFNRVVWGATLDEKANTIWLELLFD